MSLRGSSEVAMTHGPVLGATDRPDPLEEMTRSAPAAALLRSSLAALAQQHEGTPLAGLLRDVLAGRRPWQDMRRDPVLMETARRGVQDYRDHLASLTPEERVALTAEAESLAAREDD